MVQGLTLIEINIQYQYNYVTDFVCKDVELSASLYVFNVRCKSENIQRPPKLCDINSVWNPDSEIAVMVKPLP